MLLKRVGLPVLVALVAVLLTVVTVRLPFAQLALAAPAGEVTLTAPLAVPVSIHGIAPGDSGSAGAYRVRYTGNAPAWVGLDADLFGPLSGGGSPLSITVSNGENRLQAKGTDQVLGLYQPGDEIYLAVAYSFPDTAGNVYQAQDASLVFQLKAVDAADNTHYVNGRPVGPITWTGRVAPTALAPRETAQAPGIELESCVGEGCAPASATQTSATPGTTAPTATTPTVIVSPPAGECCNCLRSLLWFGLLYGLLLVFAMLAAFHLGWHLRGSRIRQWRRAMLQAKERHESKSE